MRARAGKIEARMINERGMCDGSVLVARGTSYGRKAESY